MKKSAYINYLIENLDNTLHQLQDKEKSEYYNHLHNNYNNPNATPYSFERLKSFFDFYFNELEFTPKEFLDSFGRYRTKIIDLIYDANNSYINFREELRNNFMPIIEKDIELFQHAITTCLKNHHSFELRAKESDEEYYKKILIQQEKINNDLFLDLIATGKKENLFNKINIELLHTRNDKYKKYLIENNLLDNDTFSEEYFIKLIKDSNRADVPNYKRTEAQTKLSEYKMHYLSEILENFPSPEIFKFWAEENLSYKNEKNETNLYMDENDFLKNIVNEYTVASKDIQEKFFKDWLNSNLIKNSILEAQYSYSQVTDFFDNFPNQIITFLNSLSDQDIKKITESMDFSLFKFEKNSFTKSILHSIIGLVLKQGINFDNMPIFLDKIMEFKKHSSETIVFDVMANHLLSTFIDKINDSSLEVEYKKEHLKKIIEIYIKNESINFDGLTFHNDQILQYLENADKILNTIYSLKDEMDINNYVSSLENKIKEKTNQFYSDTQEALPNSNSYYYVTKNQEKNLMKYLNILDKIKCSNETVDSDKLFKLTFDKEEVITSWKNNKSKKTIKYYPDFPALFYIALNTNNQSLLHKVFEENNLDKIENLQYKKKNIIDYWIDTKPETVSNLINILKDEPKLFNSLILSKKKTLKNLSELNNDFVNKTIDFMKLKDKLPKNSNQANKIIKM